MMGVFSLTSHICLQGQILANLNAMDSDYFSKNYIKRSSKVTNIFLLGFKLYYL